VEFPTGSGTLMNLKQVAQQISTRLVNIFIPDENNCRPCHGDIACFAEDSHWHNLVLFHEYFHGETGQGIGASHQTGWTALVIRLIEDLGKKNQSGK
jgi:hypothetical protein